MDSHHTCMVFLLFQAFHCHHNSSKDHHRSHRPVSTTNNILLNHTTQANKHQHLNSKPKCQLHKKGNQGVAKEEEVTVEAEAEEEVGSRTAEAEASLANKQDRR